MISKRRIVRLEQRWPGIKPAEEILREAEHLARRRGINLDEAIQLLLRDVPPEQLDSLIAEFESLVKSP